MAVDIVEGSYSKQYEVLWEYCHELRTRNVGSTVIIKSEMEGDRPRFQRIYICLAACKKGFLDGCRPVVCLDGCHVKGPHPGQVLSAMGVDANNGMFPLAYAYVEIESNSTWLWFLELLSGDLNITNSHGYVFMTDKQKGLIDAVDALFPHAEHRHCLKHLYGNFYLEHRGLALKHQMEAIARATTVPWFHAEMTKMLQLSKPAHDWLIEKDPRHWSRAYFKSDSKCDMLMNNLCEAFNRSIMDARDKPILTMLERIRLYIMLLMAGRRVLCEKWHGQVGPRIRKILEKNKGKAQWCIPKAAGQNQFEVMHHSGRTFAVDLNAHSCSCHAWDLNGIPCLHACAAISWFHGNPEDFCDAVYKKEAYLRAYEPMIMPMTSQDQWMKVNLPPLLPPKYHKQPGRPKKTRKQAVEEPKQPANPYKLPRYGIPLKCGNCSGEGHNRSSCKEPRNPNIKPTRKRNIAKDKLAVLLLVLGFASCFPDSSKLWHVTKGYISTINFGKEGKLEIFALGLNWSKKSASVLTSHNDTIGHAVLLLASLLFPSSQIFYSTIFQFQTPPQSFTNNDFFSKFSQNRRNPRILTTTLFSNEP
ncbi:unnamed protein product [Prunus brigantina]